MRNMLVYKQWMHGPVAEHQRWVQAFCPWRLKHHCVAINGWTVELWECWMKLLVHGSRHKVKHACFWDCSLHWKKMQSRIGMDKLILISNWMLLRQHRVASTPEVRAWTMFSWRNMFPVSPIISHQPLVIMYISLSLVFLWAPLAIFCVFSKQQSQCIKKTVVWVIWPYLCKLNSHLYVIGKDNPKGSYDSFFLRMMGRRYISFFAARSSTILPKKLMYYSCPTSLVQQCPPSWDVEIVL